MKLLVFRALWGMTGTIPEMVERIAEAGYDGIECQVLQPDAMPMDEFVKLLDAHNLNLILLSQIPTEQDIERSLKQAAEYQPLKISMHSGADSMPRDVATSFFEEALRVEAEIGIPVAHESHRGRVFFNPWDTAYYLQQFEDLKLLADYSHWVNVCERLPDDQADALELANQRAIHVHNRVGYEEGPQVPDPSAPEYASRRWRGTRPNGSASLICIRNAALRYFTVTPEYGPPNYLHTLAAHQSACGGSMGEFVCGACGASARNLTANPGV